MDKGFEKLSQGQEISQKKQELEAEAPISEDVRISPEEREKLLDELERIENEAKGIHNRIKAGIPLEEFSSREQELFVRYGKIREDLGLLAEE